jgi:diadenylate cyclase
MEGFDFSFLNLRFLDLLDIVLVALIIYYIYNLIRGTIALNILLGLVIIYAVLYSGKAGTYATTYRIIGSFCQRRFYRI